MEIEIQEEDNRQILSKTQKQKIRRIVKELWVDETSFYDHLEDVLNSVHYMNEEDRYNHIEHNLKSENHLVLLFRKVHIETPEERRKKLQKKLQNVIQQKKRPLANIDPQEQLYQRLCQQVPQQQRNLIPKPTDVRSNLDMYRQMITMMPAQNPLRQYLSTFLN